MSTYQDIRSISPELSTFDLLRLLISERFSGASVVTASLKAPSVVVLKMIADIDPATPVVFCNPGFQFPESAVYRDRIVDRLGLKTVSLGQGGEAEVLPGDQEHYERMWVDSKDGRSRSYEIVHLNETLAPYECWISAVYHMPAPSHVTQRVDIEGRLIRVDPLIRWTKDEVRAFMREKELPFHPRAVRQAPEVARDAEELPSYNY